MATVNVHYLPGGSVVPPVIESPAGEELTLVLEAFSAPDVPANLTGLYVVLHWTADPSGSETAVPVAGTSSGVSSFTFPAVTTASWLSGWFRYYVTLSGAGAPLAPPIGTSFVQITGVPALPPLQQTIQVAGVLDLGFTAEASPPHAPRWAAPSGGALGLRCVCSVPAGTVRDASATGEVRIGHLVGQNWTPVTTISLAQGTPDWSFEGFATNGNLLALPVGYYQYQVWANTALGQFMAADTGELAIEAGAGVVQSTADLRRIYYGVATAGLTGTTSIEAALMFADVLATSDFNRPLSPANQSVYLAYPAVLATPQWTVDGFAVGELSARTVTLHDSDGVARSYTLRESRFAQTGTDIHFIAEFSHA